MKKYITLIITAILSSGILFSCKKDSSPKDYSASIIDKTWCGEMTYTNDSIQYYSVSFNADKSLLWSQFAEDDPGNWGLNGKQLTMTFTGSNAVIRADITDDDRLENIDVSNTNSYKVNSGRLLANPSITLEGTVWKGTGFFAVATYPYQMSFLPGLKVEIKVNNTVSPLCTYTRSIPGSIIRFRSLGSDYYGILTSVNEMKGSVGSSSGPWRVVKQ